MLFSKSEYAFIHDHTSSTECIKCNEVPGRVCHTCTKQHPLLGYPFPYIILGYTQDESTNIGFMGAIKSRVANSYYLFWERLVLNGKPSINFMRAHMNNTSIDVDYDPIGEIAVPHDGATWHHELIGNIIDRIKVPGVSTEIVQCMDHNMSLEDAIQRLKDRAPYTMWGRFNND